MTRRVFTSPSIFRDALSGTSTALAYQHRMPNLASIFKAEAARIARKQTTPELKAIRSVQTQQRSALAAMKKRIEQLERQVRQLSRQSGSNNDRNVIADGPAEKYRFSAKGLASHRVRLGLSAADAGRLIGVSPLTVYNWEKGATKPRTNQLPSIAAFRGLGKREANARLEEGS